LINAHGYGARHGKQIDSLFSILPIIMHMSMHGKDARVLHAHFVVRCVHQINKHVHILRIHACVCAGIFECKNV